MRSDNDDDDDDYGDYDVDDDDHHHPGDCDDDNMISGLLCWGQRKRADATSQRQVGQR